MTLVGHDEAWRAWRTAMASERMHHAWLLTGQRGLGKGSFARAAAAALVAKPGAAEPSWTTHPDILMLDNLPDGDDEAKKRDEGKPFKLKRNIGIDQIRRMQARLTTRPTLGSRRAIIIDPADDLERPAANALLKSLEEPPQGSYFLLVAHQPSRLPPTVRSRCRVLRFPPLAPAEIDRLLREEAPDADAATRAAAVQASRGAPGAALSFIERKLAPLDAIIRRIVAEGDPGLALRGALVDAVGPRPERERLLMLFDLCRAALADGLASAGRTHQARIIAAQEQLVALGAQAPTYNFEPALLMMEIGGLLASAAMPTEAPARA